MPLIISDWCAAVPEYGAGLFVTQFHGSPLQESPPSVPATAPAGNASSTQTVAGVLCGEAWGPSTFARFNRPPVTVTPVKPGKGSPPDSTRVLTSFWRKPGK